MILDRLFALGLVLIEAVGIEVEVLDRLALGDLRLVVAIVRRGLGLLTAIAGQLTDAIAQLLDKRGVVFGVGFIGEPDRRLFGFGAIIGRALLIAFKGNHRI